jgi:ECF transporter S component (folate family)
MWKRLLYSETILALSKSKKVAYIGVVTAFTVVVNAMFEIKLGGVQFSLTIFASVLAGLIIGAAPGFLACFMGDLIGFLLHPYGEYSPVIGIATGLMAVFAALIIQIPTKGKGETYAKLAIVCLVIFLVCTAGLNNWYLNQVYYTELTFFECLNTRLLAQGQILNTLVNSALVVLLIPVLAKIKALKLKIR